MIIVNTTFYVEQSIEQDFLDWLKERYLSSVSMSSPSVARILGVAEEGVSAFAVKLHLPTMNEAEAMVERQSVLVNEEIVRTYGERVLHFTTFMETVEL
ncbi:MAG: DUF4286 family protein [Muribaculaceae bacterium]|nr:DUF4286 family protein [Muribaculaceae bacterium]